ncbi:WGR domain-containing protein [Photobacterium kasasachensis]|uniref:WGR domain-containing protein n=1 Tax=Photobacterium kasasachensis TaxID=2910240 RepID=UPI003D0C67D7
MKLIRKSQLYFQEGNSDKVYEVDLVKTTSLTEDKYLVNFRYGRRGNNLREGTKTPQPVNKERAIKLFNSVVVSKINKGYKESGTSKAPVSLSTTSTHESAISLINRIKIEKNESDRARQIWRLPPEKNPDAAALISGYLGHNIWQYDYSILWVLGRIGSDKNIPDVAPFLSDANQVIVNLAREVILALAEPIQRRNIYLKLFGCDCLLTPELIKEEIAKFRISHRRSKGKHQINSLLKDAYLQSLFEPSIRETLISVLPDIPFAPGAFKGLRYLIKMSEFRLDTEIYTLLNIHFEASRPHFFRDWDHIYAPGVGRLDVQKELTSDNARLAHSHNTHRYFIARFWRTLKQLGVTESDRYIQMAEQTLLKYSEQDAKKPGVFHDYEYDDQWRQQLSRIRHYDEYAHCSALNSIIRSNHPGYCKNRRGIWNYSPDVEFNGRGEAFSHLWDNEPQSLLRIAVATNCAPVSDFAIRALEDNSDFCDALPTDSLIQLLLKPFEMSQHLALQQLKSKQSVLTADHIIKLLSSTVIEVIEFAIEQLNKINDLHSSTWLLAQLLCIDNEKLRNWLNSSEATTKLHLLDQPKLLADAIEAFQTHELDNHKELNWVYKWLIKHCGTSMHRLALEPVEQLIQSPSQVKVLLGCKLLDAMPISYNHISNDTLDAINSSPSKEIQSYSILLFKKLKPEDLTTKLDYLLKILIKCSAQKQAAIIGVLTEAVISHAQNREKVFNHIINLLHSKELEQSLQQKLITLLTQCFEREISDNDSEAIWRLASARSEIAHSLAAEYLNSHTSGAVLNSGAQFLPAQWLLLLSSPTVRLRESARSYFNQNPAELIAQMDRILSVMESPWPDTQTYAFEFCHRYMDKDNWQADQIVAICDSVLEPVQRFGRELIQTYFNDGDGKQYLLWLSQHPSPDVELFVSQFLPQYAAGDEAVILALKPYCLSVLSRVNSGRTAKDRVIRFLQEQAHTSKKTLDMVCDLLTRMSLTSVKKDKAAYIKLMLNLKSHHQNLFLPITKKSVKCKSRQRKTLTGVEE